MTDKELRDLIAETFEGIRELKEAQLKTDAQLAKTDAQLAKTDAQLAKTDAQLAKTDAKVAKLAELYGNASNNQGDVAEEFFYNSLKEKKSLAGIHYDFVDYNWSTRVGTVQDEFDIVMVNGKDIAIIEVKYKANDKDLEKLLTKKIENFKLLYPLYKDYNHHLGLASFHMNKDLIERALEKGVVVLQRKGDVMETYLKVS